MFVSCLLVKSLANSNIYIVINTHDKNIRLHNNVEKYVYELITDILQW